MSDLDELMTKDPLDLSDQDIEAIIAHHRNIRAKRASGEKPTKSKIDISSIMNKVKPKEEVKIERRKI